MTTFSIDGIEVHFPFEPYEEQKAYMTKVLECITQRRVGVLESPTGTGKTLSLLCSTLSWLQHNRGNADLFPDEPPPPLEGDEPFSNVAPNYMFPRIIYSSRTHSQLSKAMTELQKTAFKNFNVTILGSRDQMCIHPTVMKETNLTLKNALCAMHMKAKSCYFGNNVDKVKKDHSIFAETITDIEDLIVKSRKISCCPYYLARELQAKADVIFMPYNYLFDYHIRKALKISLLNAIVILDEAHNIDKVCEEASSVSIKSSDIALAITDVTREMQSIHDDLESGYMAEREYSNEELCFLKEKLTALESVVDEFPVTKDHSITRSGIYVFEILKKAGIDIVASEQLIRISTQIYEYLSNVSDTSNRRGGSLKKLADDLTVIFSTIQGSNILSSDKNFRVHIEEELFKNFNKNSFKNEKPGKVVHYWCFNPGYCLGSTVKEEVRCVILTSGTLAPISSYVKEMALVNPVTVECNHIIENDQVLVIKLEAGPRNTPLKCTYANRQNLEFWQELGLTLQNYFRIIPDGLLIFFPGYATLFIAIKMWKESGLWDKLAALKPIFIEPQNKSELPQITLEYYRAIDTGRGKGAAFLGVCRGKISEGLDFSDQYGRAVIITGLPYPPLHDPKVKLKKQYIDSNKSSSNDMTGETWYMLEATKAVNQAIGRVIRHNKDYGAIILCDTQFNNKNIVQNLSKWVQSKIVKAKSFGDSVRLLSSFYRKNNCTMPPSPIKIPPESSQSYACQPSFSQSNSSQKRADIKCLESYLNRISANIQPPQPGPSNAESSTQSDSTFSIIRITGNRTLNKQLKVISNLINHYEAVCNMTAQAVPKSAARSCLESLDSDETNPVNKLRYSLNLLNKDTLKDEDLLGVLNNVLGEFEEKKNNLDLPPENIFDVGAEGDGSRESLSSNESGNEFQLDGNTCSVIRSLISRLQNLNRHLAIENSKRGAHRMSEVSLVNGILPAKRRKIKLQTIKLEDIQLPGSDERSRAREKRLNDTKNFLLELKALLEPSSYYSLINLIKKFNSREDFQEAVKYLQVLFPESDEEFRSIFKRCYLLFTGEWEKEFHSYCEVNNIS